MIVRTNCFNFQQIADSGQCFRMNKISDNTFSVVAFEKKLIITQNKNEIDFNCSEKEFDSVWKDYFDLNTSYEDIIKKLSEPEDIYLRNAIEYGKGIRILKQEPFETLISFIISQQMKIPRIKQLVEILSENYGKKISENTYAFPTAAELARADESELSRLNFGYRAKYIANTARAVAAGEFDLNKPYDLALPDCISYLKTLCGVGEKVANCVALFAYHKTDAFPIDVWMKKIINEHYNGNFDVSACGEYAGIAQQYMFFAERTRQNKII